MFFHPLDNILSSVVRVRLLRTLLGLARPVSGREAARLAATALPMTQRVLAELVELGIVQREEMPAQHLYRVNDAHQLVREGLRPLFAAEERRSAAVIAELRRILADEAAKPAMDVESVYVFGSAARGDDAPGSDFDLLVITSSAAGAEAAHDLLSSHSAELFERFGIVLSPVALDRDAARHEAMIEGSFLRAALQDGRRIHGADLEDIVDGETRTA
jgi:predicted nucleotidyltransferase